MSQEPSTPAKLTTQEKIILFFLPNIADIVFLFSIQIPLFLRSSYVFGDGSTGWHLVTGQWILENHQIPYHDLVSYTFPDKAWVAYEWLSDVIMALLVKAGGMNLLAVCVSFSIAWLLVLLYGRCRKEGAHFALALWLMILGTIVTFIHWLARPVVFCFYGVYLFSTRLEDFHAGKIGWKKLIIPLVLYMALWVNTHPAFLFGLVLCGIYVFANLISLAYYAGSERAAQYVSRLKVLSAASVACFTATLLNPYGINLYRYIVDYLKGSIVLANNGEFASPSFHLLLQPTCLEILFAMFVAGLAITRARLSLPRLLTCIAFGHEALSAVRNMPLYVTVILPAISQLFSSVSFGTAREAQSSLLAGEAPAPSDAAPDAVPGWRTKLSEKWNKMTALFDENEALCDKHLWPILLFVVLTIASLNGGKLLGNNLLSCDWGPEDKPTATLEFLRQAEEKGSLDPNRGFNFDNWGGYIRYRLGHRVFIDDRSDFYGTPFYLEYATITQTEPGWEKLLDQRKIQWVLAPKNSRLEVSLLQTPGWEKAAEDQAAYLIVRK